VTTTTTNTVAAAADDDNGDERSSSSCDNNDDPNGEGYDPTMKGRAQQRRAGIRTRRVRVEQRGGYLMPNPIVEQSRRRLCSSPLLYFMYLCTNPREGLALP